LSVDNGQGDRLAPYYEEQHVSIHDPAAPAAAVVPQSTADEHLYRMIKDLDNRLTEALATVHNTLANHAANDGTLDERLETQRRRIAHQEELLNQVLRTGVAADADEGTGYQTYRANVDRVVTQTNIELADVSKRLAAVERLQAAHSNVSAEQAKLLDAIDPAAVQRVFERVEEMDRAWRKHEHQHDLDGRAAEAQAEQVRQTQAQLAGSSQAIVRLADTFRTYEEGYLATRNELNTVRSDVERHQDTLGAIVDHNRDADLARKELHDKIMALTGLWQELHDSLETHRQRHENDRDELRKLHVPEGEQELVANRLEHVEATLESIVNQVRRLDTDARRTDGPLAARLAQVEDDLRQLDRQVGLPAVMDDGAGTLTPARYVEPWAQADAADAPEEPAWAARLDNPGVGGDLLDVQVRWHRTDGTTRRLIGRMTEAAVDQLSGLPNVAVVWQPAKARYVVHEYEERL
jgi:predicted  nucleic acid-binding Zn-ribbon protein